MRTTSAARRLPAKFSLSKFHPPVINRQPSLRLEYHQQIGHRSPLGCCRREISLALFLTEIAVRHGALVALKILRARRDRPFDAHIAIGWRRLLHTETRPARRAEQGRLSRLAA